MKTYYYFFLAGVILISSAYSIDTSSIEALRDDVKAAKRELSSSELDQISAYFSNALDLMMLSKTSSEMVEVRKEIEDLKGDEFLSFYASGYITVAHKEIQTAFANTQRLGDADQRLMINRNLMILAAQLKSPKLADIALERLDDPDDLIRYWAVKAVTQPALVVQLSGDTGDQEALADILKGLKEHVVDEQHPQIQSMAVVFCQTFSNDPAARDFLLSIAAGRIEAYKNWTASNLTSDVDLLTALGNVAMMQTDAEIKKTFGRAFAELYAMAFQWYFKGADSLSNSELQDLQTVLAEVDKKVLERSLKIKTGILRALQRKTGLERDYETLFGDRLRSGQLAALFNFDYGKDASGKTLTAPPELSAPPQTAETN